mgnify:CR=1 FL=1
MEEVECSFKSGNNWFRLRSCAILIHDGKVLMVKNKRDPYYYSIGGGVRHGESLEKAVKREVLEETGCSLEIDRLAFIHENFFIGKDGPLNGFACHEIAFYYLMKWQSEFRLVSKSTTSDGIPERLEWLQISKLDELGIPVYPTFFAEELKKISYIPKHIVTSE